MPTRRLDGSDGVASRVVAAPTTNALAACVLALRRSWPFLQEHAGSLLHVFARCLRIRYPGKKHMHAQQRTATISRARVSYWAAGGCAGSHHRQLTIYTFCSVLLTAILLHLLLFCHSQADSPRTFNHTQSRARECRGNLAALGASRKASRKITSVQTSMKTPRNTRILVATNATKGGGWCGRRHRAIAACYLSVPASNRTGDKTLILLMNNAHACLFVHRLRHPHGVERSQRRQDGAADPH